MRPTVTTGTWNLPLATYTKSFCICLDQCNYAILVSKDKTIVGIVDRCCAYAGPSASSLELSIFEFYAGWMSIISSAPTKLMDILSNYSTVANFNSLSIPAVLFGGILFVFLFQLIT